MAVQSCNFPNCRTKIAAKKKAIFFYLETGICPERSVRILYHSAKFFRDRKKKKFVRENEDPKKKKIKTESGAWISASYKSNAYPFK